MKTKYKVVIIGCGPSGISTALNLINNGINDILIIEKYKIPRYKCCAGYITNKTKKMYEAYGLDLSNDNIRLFTTDRNKNGLVEIHRVQVSEELIKMNQPLSRLWINGLLGGVPELL